MDASRSLNPEVAATACMIMTRAEAMGVLEAHENADYSADLLNDALAGFARAGIGRTAIEVHQRRGDLRGALEQLNDEIEASPVPETEWRSVTGILGEELTAKLCGVSRTSVRRYGDGQRRTPDDVANRLHFVALVVADLLGAYNAYGIRRWFNRPRSLLDGNTPAEVLAGSWTPDDDNPRRVASLARQLVTMSAT
jgi:hypothetical protein